MLIPKLIAAIFAKILISFYIAIVLKKSNRTIHFS